MLQLFVQPGTATYDVPSLDPQSLISASYLQLLKPGEWEIVACTDTGLSPNGSLPYLRDGADSYAESAILPHLLRSSHTTLSPLQLSESAAFHALLNTTVLPLTLHSLYSLPTNWSFIRPLIAAELPFPTKLYRPEQLRESAKAVVESTQEGWWGLGGEAEKDAEDEKRRKRVLLDTGSDAWKERKDEERKEGKETIKKAFGKGKIASAAREVFMALETTLAASSTPFFFSSSSPSPLDAHLSSLLSLVLYLPLPQPLLADLINASFPRLWTHSALLRRTLWSSPPPSAALPPSLLPSFRFSSSELRAMLPSFSLGGDTKGKEKKLSDSEVEFAKRRWHFFGVVVLGMVGWTLGTGLVPLPRWLSTTSGEVEEVEEEWEEVEEYVR